MGGIAEYVSGPTELDDPPGVHDCNRRRPVLHDRQIVAHVDAAHIVALAELANRREHMALGRDVEPGRRLVEDDQRGPPHERQRERDALLLAAGELVWVAMQVLARGGEGDLLENVVMRLSASSLDPEWP